MPERNRSADSQKALDRGGSTADRELNVPNSAANKEPAEGSREPEGGGITNRRLDEKQSSQAQVPPRGKTKEESDA